MIKIFICDDNQEFLNHISEKIYKISINNNLNVEIKKYLNGNNMLFDLEYYSENVDIFFIDILMEGLTGIDVSKKIREYNLDAQIIFISSSKSYVFDALDVMPLHYLIKSEINDDIIERILMKAVKLASKNRMRGIIYKVGRSQKFIKNDNIIFFEINNRVVSINCVDRVEKFYSSMENLESIIDKNEFIRIHRSYIVNITKINCITKKNVVCIDGSNIPIGNKYSENLKEKYSKFILNNIYN